MTGLILVPADKLKARGLRRDLDGIVCLATEPTMSQHVTSMRERGALSPKALQMASKPKAEAFTGPLARVKALAAAVATDPACKGKAAAALALLCDDDLAAVTPNGMAKLLRNAPASWPLSERF